jgi:hypothetical protein
MGGKGMPQYMRSARLDNAGPANGVLERALQRIFCEVMTTDNVRTRIARATACGKDVLPAPLLIGVWIFPVKRMRQVYAP